MGNVVWKHHLVLFSLTSDGDVLVSLSVVVFVTVIERLLSEADVWFVCAVEGQESGGDAASASILQQLPGV